MTFFHSVVFSSFDLILQCSNKLKNFLLQYVNPNKCMV